MKQKVQLSYLRTRYHCSHVDLIDRRLDFAGMMPVSKDYRFWHLRRSRLCNSSKNLQGFTDGWQKDEFGALSECEERRELQGSTVPQANEVDFERNLALAVWRKLVTAYTDRHLTVATDRILTPQCQSLREKIKRRGSVCFF